MKARRAQLAVGFALLTLAPCGEPGDPTHIGMPSFAAGGVGRPSVLVNPNADDKGTAKTIQEGIATVAEGGKVMVVPGTYNEAVLIDKGLTLEAVGGESGPVVVAPPGTVNAAIQVATPDPVTIRGLTVQFTGVRGIFGTGVVDVTIERTSVVAVNPPLGVSALISMFNDVPTTGRARAVVRESSLDGSLPPANSPTPAFPQIFGISVAGDIDARLEGNVIRRTGGACIFVIMNNNLAGETNRKSTRLNSSHSQISYAVFCLKKKKKRRQTLFRHHCQPYIQSTQRKVRQSTHLNSRHHGTHQTDCTDTKQCHRWHHRTRLYRI